jgi:circadian clock protein KaiC
LITGAPGTAKSTLAGTFVEAAYRRGERTVLFVLDEAAQKMVRNLRSAGVDLRPHFDADRLRIVGRRAGAVGAEQHLLVMEGEIEDFAPARVAVDPLSAMVKAGGPLSALSVAQRLILLTKSAGITLLAGQNPEVGTAPLQVSTRADTWIHLRYDVHAGERNPTLSIVKSRGTGHSNQVRELVLSDASISLKEVYVAGREGVDRYHAPAKGVTPGLRTRNGAGGGRAAAARAVQNRSRSRGPDSLAARPSEGD